MITSLSNLKSNLKVFSGFIFFGILVFIFIFTLPIFHLIYFKNKENLINIVQDFIRMGFKLFLKFLHIINFININLEELKNNHLNKIIIANHISLLDTVIILSFVKNCYVIVNPKFSKNLLLSKIIQSAGYVILKSHSPQNKIKAYQECISLLKRGKNILIFPEAHRSLNGDLSKFSKGAFHLSIILNEKISAIYFKSDKPFLTSKTSFDNSNKVINLSLIYLGEIVPSKEIPISRNTIKKYTEDSFKFFLERMKT